MGSAEQVLSDAVLERARAERGLVFTGPDGKLFGIFTPPAPGAPLADCCVVFFSRPRAHRNRMWVEGARRIAAAGFAAFRFDYHGLGDSEGELTFQDPGKPFRGDAVAVLRGLRQELGQRRFILVGSCFDARTALSAFTEEGDHIDGLCFIAAPTMEIGNLEQAALAGDEAVQRLPLSPGFVADFEQLVRSQARVLFLYGEEDAEYVSFRAAEQRLIQPLAPSIRERFDIEVWSGAVHGFLSVARQREGLEFVLNWMRRLAVAEQRDAA